MSPGHFNNIIITLPRGTSSCRRGALCSFSCSDTGRGATSSEPVHAQQHWLSLIHAVFKSSTRVHKYTRALNTCAFGDIISCTYYSQRVVGGLYLSQAYHHGSRVYYTTLPPANMPMLNFFLYRHRCVIHYTAGFKSAEHYWSYRPNCHIQPPCTN